MSTTAWTINITCPRCRFTADVVESFEDGRDQEAEACAQIAQAEAERYGPRIGSTGTRMRVVAAAIRARIEARKKQPKP